MDSSSDLQLTGSDAHAIVLTLASALLAVLVDLAPGVALAWLLARKQWPGKSVVETLVALPLVLPPVATGLLLLDLLGRNAPLGSALESLALGVVFTWKAVAVAMAVMSFPFIVRGARIAFEAAGDRPEQVASTLGASPLRVLFSVTLPIAWRGITAGAVMAYARALGEFGAVILVAGNIPGVTATISTTMYNDILTGHDQHALLLAAISIVLAFALILTGEQLLRRAPSMTSRLVLRQIEVALGAFHLAIDVELQPGCVGIFGPSGAGKTTLLEIITGLRRVRKGHIALGEDVLADVESGKWIPPHLRRIGYVPQDLALFPHLNVRRNILYGAPAESTEPSVDSLIEILDLGPLLDRRIAGLSGGERQRVALARALSAKPRLLLLDEPLTGLDQDRKDNVLDYLRLLRKRWAVPMIYISHQADEMAGLCDEILVIRDGKIAARGKPEEIFEPTEHPAWRLRRTLCVSPEERHVGGA